MVALAVPALSRFFADPVRAYRLRFGIFVVLLVLCCLGGGGSRGDITSLLYLRPAAVVALAAILLVPGPVDFKAIRAPFWLLVGLTVWMALQLVPLPPAIWTSLPGRAPVVAGASVIGIEQPWRALSTSPDLTLDSLASMVVPFAALLGMAALDREGRERLLPVLIGIALISALLGIAQISGGATSPFYMYRVTNEDA